jgi:transposase
MDGKLLLVTNATDLTAQEVVQRHKALADIERGFRVLKSEIEIGPVYHRLPERIRAHAQICFMALILHRVMRARLHSAHTGLWPERALEHLTRIHHHRIPSRRATRSPGCRRLLPNKPGCSAHWG